jgi:hypothetical protein
MTVSGSRMSKEERHRAANVYTQALASAIDATPL